LLLALQPGVSGGQVDTGRVWKWVELTWSLCILRIELLEEQGYGGHFDEEDDGV